MPLFGCLRLPREILCWAFNSILLAVILAYIVQAVRSGVWPWTNFIDFWRQEDDFWFVALISIISVYLIGGCIFLVLSRIRAHRTQVRERTYQRLDLVP